MIRTIRPLDRPDPGLERVAKANGFSLHAGVSCEGHQKEKVRAGKARETALGHKRERLCRYIARPAVAVPRLSLSSTGKVLYTLKTPYLDGTTQVVFDRGGHPHRYRGLQSLRRIGQGHRLYRGPGNHRQNPGSPTQNRARHPCSCRVSKVSEKDLQDQQCEH